MYTNNGNTTKIMAHDWMKCDYMTCEQLTTMYLLR